MQSRKHPETDSIAKVVRRHWMSIPDDYERVKAVTAEALKVFASDMQPPQPLACPDWTTTWR
jgi:hypothetical protein